MIISCALFGIRVIYRVRAAYFSRESVLPHDPRIKTAVDHAAQLRAQLVERAEATESARRLPASTLADLHTAGLFRLLQPARVGGGQLPLAALVEVTAELARSCASTAWVLANLASHHWLLGMWPQSAQDTVWGKHGEHADTLIGASLIFPAGRAQPCSTGFRLTGCWNYASGIDDCDWVILGAIVEGDGYDSENTTGVAGEYRLFLLPRSDYSLRDTWQAAGLCGSGSNEVNVAGINVPTERSLSLTALHDTAAQRSLPALYRLPLLPGFGHVIAAVALGIAQGMLDLFVDDSRNRLTSYSGRVMTDYPSVHLRVAEAAASIDAARRILLDNCATLMQTAECTTTAASLIEKMRWRRDAAFAARLCRQALDLLFDACGGAALYLSHPAQRNLRDMRAVCAHISLNWDAAASLYGSVAVGHSADLPPYER
ncbi:MAG: acyl-CoA dehydrogenase family protein [Sterolibacterium sp.]|nr:acyl-CoA dehydrogenase family protein [Sterolibacterium sp.]